MAATIPIMTIGFTQTSAESFFERLINAGVRKVVDVRLHNTSQLAGFAKAGDLEFLLGRVAGIDYAHEPLLAPTDEMLLDYKKRNGDWQIYEQRFLALMAERKIESHFTPDTLRNTCLLCSEAKPHYCHRRLVVEYLNSRWSGAISVAHL
jgi:uncharacterized protein (DUF488 family)